MTHAQTAPLLAVKIDPVNEAGQGQPRLDLIPRAKICRYLLSTLEGTSYSPQGKLNVNLVVNEAHVVVVA
jgi:hypothetical protein